MATMSTSITASGSFTLTDSNGTVIFSYSPSFTTTTQTTGAVISTGEILTDGTSATTINLGRHNKDRLFTFIKNVDKNYSVAVNPDGDTIANLKPGECFFSPVHIDGAADGSANLDLVATTAAQKVQYLLCDGLDTGIGSDD